MKKNSILILLSGLAIGLLANQIVRMNHTSMRAEVKLTLMYINSLQEAHFLQNKSYIEIAEFYGASINGADNCVRPKGAEQLGFILNWCHQENASPVRYAYRVKSSTDGFLSEAYSGSDQNKLSLVCLQSDKNEIWQMDETKQLKPIILCN